MGQSQDLAFFCGKNMDNQFPKWMYGPNGEAEIFTSEEDIPEGWKDTPAAFEQPKTGDTAVMSLEVGNDAVAENEPDVHEVKQKVTATVSSATVLGKKRTKRKK